MMITERQELLTTLPDGEIFVVLVEFELAISSSCSTASASSIQR